MAERPYVNKSIQDLEALFRKAGEAAPLLQALQYELSFRKTQRAKSLLKSISEQLGQTNTNSQSAKPTSQSSPAAQSNSGDAPSVQLKQKNCLQEFISALNLEAEAIKQQSRERAISVHNGELIEFSEGMYLYQFVLDEDVYLRDDAPLVVEFGDKEVNGNVASVKDKSIKIFIEENLGPHIAYAQIKTNDSFLVERLKERLESLGKSDTEISVNMQGFYRSLGLEQTKVGSAENEFVEVSSLNDEQQQALRVSKGSDLLFLWGPPGTGKTHALAKIIEEFYRADKRVLLTSNTNLAVDTLLQKLCEALVESSEPGFLQGSVIRHGTIVKEELQSEFSSYVSVNEVVERVSASLVSEREGLLDEEEKLLDYAEQCAKIISAFNMIPDTQAKLMQTRQQLEAFKSELEKRKQQKIDLDEKRDALEQQFEEIEGWGFVKKALYGSKETRVRTELEQTKKRFLEVSTQILEAPLRKAELREAIPKLEHQINVLNRLTQGKEKAAIESEHEGTQIKIDDIKDRLAEIADELANIKEKVKQNCKVLAATATQVYLKPDEFKDFDVVVVDEASMLILPLAAYAASLGRAKAIIAGDFRQLSPIVTSRDKVVQALLGKDIFEQAGIARAVAQGQAPAHLVKLNTQYRMAKDICDLINMPFYGGTLKTGRGAVANYPSKLLASNVQIIDTSSLVPFVNLRPGTYSRYNVLHALAIRNIVQLLTAENILDQNRSLGVVSPYKEQAKFVGKLFSELGMDSIACGTVHSYQGNEKHIIIYDIADS
ncbi:MAG: DNA2/NAM7 family helicase, partial [Gammaproteobacteria bacterium]|nr:DNA2/NAM7 family helicase [Gammaproteobacteria bacterium]